MCLVVMGIIATKHMNDVESCLRLGRDDLVTPEAVYSRLRYH